MSNNLVEKSSNRCYIKFCDICQKETKHYIKSDKCVSCAARNSSEKAQQTMIKRYGVAHALQSEEIKERLKKTCLEKYGCENPFGNKEIQEKSRKTNLEKFGVDNVAKLPEIQERMKQTCIRRYGVENYSQTDEYVKKVKKTCIEKFGVESPLKSDKFKEKSRKTCRQKYGVDNAAKLPEIQNKMKKTCLNRYGVENYNQSINAAKNHRSRFSYNNIYFDSSWELAYYIYLTDNNVDFSYQSDPIEYHDSDNKKHYWIPDFEVEGQLIEIKGNHFFTESGQFINPYDRSEKADEHNMAKYNCMLEHNVKIMKSEEIRPILEYINNTYGRQFLESCRC